MKTYIFKFSVLSILFLSLVLPGNTSTSQGENLEYLPLVQNCIAPAYPLLNGDFEQGSDGWSFDQWSMASAEMEKYGFLPHSGNWMGFIPSALAGGFFPTIQQSVTVPVCTPYLGFWWSAKTGCNPVSGDRCGSFLQIYINNSPFETITGEIIQPWHKTIVDLSAYGGQTVLLSFVQTNEYDSTSIALDDIAFQSDP